MGASSEIFSSSKREERGRFKKRQIFFIANLKSGEVTSFDERIFLAEDATTSIFLW